MKRTEEMVSSLRYDALQKRWVIIATERQHRPQDFGAGQSITVSREHCPFCAGREQQTPPEIAAIRPLHSEPDTPGWRVRVIENKYPALRISNAVWELGAEGFYETIPGYGAHEVIIEGPDHDKSFIDLPSDLAFDILSMYRERLNVHMDDLRLKYTLIFKNHGATAGASLLHPHSQIIATPVTPRTIRMELMSTLKHFAETNRCMICDMVQKERDEGERIIYDDGTIVAFANYAARFPYELFIAPARHETFYNRENDHTLHCLVNCLKDVLGRLRTLLSDPPYN
ncbi:MAG TPA: galactose-1-phosphate uridylyltransferase, partial [Bacteroidetes bacterium]|nr:galactose-1-phosphate uridylyltransferase [Bacteroidota bacterium]